LDYTDTLESEIPVSRLFQNQEVPWVRGSYTGFIPRRNLAHSFSFKKYQTHDITSSDDIAYARYTAFANTPNITNPDRGDFLEVSFGTYNPALTGTNKVEDSQYKVILKNAVIDSIFNDYDHINSANIWTTYSIKYGECIKDVSSDDYILTDNGTGTAAFKIQTIPSPGSTSTTPWNILWTNDTVGVSENGRTITIAPNYTNLFALSGFQSTVGDDITIDCPMGRYVYFEEEEGNDIEYDNGSGTTIIAPPSVPMGYIDMTNSKPRWSVDDWTIRWDGVSKWEILNDVLLFEAEEDVAYPWLVSYWTQAPVIITGNIVTILPYVKATEFVTYANNIDTVSLSALSGIWDYLPLQTTVLTLSGATSTGMTTLSSQTSQVLYGNF
jgi:hypothetical protein